MKNISVVVLAKNEEKNIKNCLDSLKWCDEIIVIDDYSSDKTAKIAEELGAKIYVRSLDNFSNQRNFGLSKTNAEWVLYVDADEKVSEALAFEISNVIYNWTNANIEKPYKGFRIPRIDFLWERELKHGESGIKLLRLARKNAGKWGGMVHERWMINGSVGILKNPIVHFPHPTIAFFLKEINFYTTLRAKELYLNKKKSSILSIIIYPTGKFFSNFFLKKGFLDGIYGLIHSLLMSFHSFLVRAKLWIMWDKK